MSILELLNKQNKRTLFTTPTHNQKSARPKWLKGLYKHDYSELDGFDNLQNPTGVILETMEKITKIYGTQRTFMLTNGSTSGIVATMMSVLKPNDRVLVARNCHKAVYNGLVLSGAIVDWFMPDTNSEWGLYDKINPKTLEDNIKLNSYKMVIITSPTYEGINSDIKTISNICHQYGAYLFVDEAHGALYNFSDLLPETAIQQGADFSVNSLHKTGGAPNPCALLHISKNCAIDLDKIQNSLNLITTTSPSYPMLASIEANVDYLYLKGHKEIEKILKNIDKFQKKLTYKGYEFLDNDKMKIVLRKPNCNMLVLSQILSNGFNIEDEMATSSYLLFLTGIGTSTSKMNKLKNALNFIKIPHTDLTPNDFQPYPFVKLQPYQAFNKEDYEINSKDALLKISSEIITTTPPCSAIIYPGEVIQEWHLNKIGEKIKVLNYEQ